MASTKLVRLNSRMPKIKFRKGGHGFTPAFLPKDATPSPPAPPSSMLAVAPPVASAGTRPMAATTASAPATAVSAPATDISPMPAASVGVDLPDDLGISPRRQMHQEEMEHVNTGGGKPYDPPVKQKKGAAAKKK